MYILRTVTNNLWKSARPVSAIVWMHWNDLGELEKRSVHDESSGFL